MSDLHHEKETDKFEDDESVELNPKHKDSNIKQVKFLYRRCQGFLLFK